MDISGETQRDITHNIVKSRLSPTGALVNAHSAELRNEIDKINEQRQDGYCGSCYGGLPPPSGCCNSCDSVRESYVQKGWSFGNPDAIEQVRLVLLPNSTPCTDSHVSAFKNIGQNVCKSSPQRAATSRDAFGSIKLSVISIFHPANRSSPRLPISTSLYHISRTMATATTSATQYMSLLSQQMMSTM